MSLRIKELRKERSWTIDQLAEVSGLSRGYVSQLETGKRQPSAETLDNLAHCFGVKITDLYEVSEQEPTLQGMLDAFRTLDEKQRQTVFDLILMLQGRSGS